MAFCETGTRWTMTLIRDGDSDPAHVEILFFTDVTINANGVITGVVRVADVAGPQMSQLRGRCMTTELSGLPLVSRMSFIFRVKKGAREFGLHMTGIAYNPTAAATFNPFFSGTWRTFAIDTNTPSSGGGTGELQSLVLAADPGETGTGNGNQT
jgi:hypothetical protein